MIDPKFVNADYFHLIIQNNPDLICRYNLDKKIEFINDTIETVTGRGADEYKGKSIWELGYPPYFVEKIEKGFDACVASKSKHEIEIFTEGGEVSNKYFSIIFVPIMAEESNGSVIGVFSVSRDITRIKELELSKEKQIRELDILSKRILNKTNKLQNFAYIVTHNLRSHVANIIGLTGLFDQTISEAEKEDLMAMLKTSGMNLNQTLEELSDVVKISQSIDLEQTQISLKDVIEKLKESLSISIQQTKAQIETDFADCETVLYNKAYMESIIQNLLTNAIKYRHPQRPPLIKLRSEKVKNGVYLYCKDNGVGIDLDRFGSKIFELYNTFHFNQDARGVGLYITKNQIESLGGKIEVKSTPGIGTEFIIFLNYENSPPN